MFFYKWVTQQFSPFNRFLFILSFGFLLEFGVCGKTAFEHIRTLSKFGTRNCRLNIYPTRQDDFQVDRCRNCPHKTKRLTSRDSSDQVEDLTTKLAAGVPRVPRLGRLMVEESEQGSRWNSFVFVLAARCRNGDCWQCTHSSVIHRSVHDYIECLHVPGHARSLDVRSANSYWNLFRY